MDFEYRTIVNIDGTIETVSVLKLWHFNHDEKKAIGEMIIIDELSFSFVEHEGFHKFCKVAIPAFIPLSHATISRDCYGLFIGNRKTFRNLFKNLTSRVFHTLYTWTSSQKNFYMCLTAHSINDIEIWLKNYHVFPIDGQSRKFINKAVDKCVLKWGLKRVLTLTVNNASSNDLEIKYF